jgi:tRNA threonylcarbamoyladenosine biosynthesis protein TsaB
MNVHAIETSVPEASLCLSVNGDTVFSTSWHAERNHDAHLFPALQQALDALPDSEKLDYLLVGAGPGSYGGVRVALAAGVGITTVTGARLVAVESWAQLAEGEACVVADARRGGWTVRRPGGDIEVLSTEELLALRNPIFTVEAAGTLPARGIDQVQREALVPSAEGLIRTWMALDDTQRRSLQEKPAEPIYVRPPHITTSTRKPWEI